jgi:hypothetical protein
VGLVPLDIAMKEAGAHLRAQLQVKPSILTPINSMFGSRHPLIFLSLTIILSSKQLLFLLTINYSTNINSPEPIDYPIEGATKFSIADILS